MEISRVKPIVSFSVFNFYFLASAFKEDIDENEVV